MNIKSVKEKLEGIHHCVTAREEENYEKAAQHTARCSLFTSGHAFVDPAHEMYQYSPMMVP
jgi:hypothetical protein